MFSSRPVGLVSFPGVRTRVLPPQSVELTPPCSRLLRWFLPRQPPFKEQIAQVFTLCPCLAFTTYVHRVCSFPHPPAPGWSCASGRQRSPGEGVSGARNGQRGAEGAGAEPALCTAPSPPNVWLIHRTGSSWRAEATLY